MNRIDFHRLLGKKNTDTSNKKIYTILGITFAFAAAIVFWLYVLGYDSPTYTKEFTVSVDIRGNEELMEKADLSVLSDVSFTMKIELVGTQNDVGKVKTEDIDAYIDVSGITLLDIEKSNEVVVPIIVDIPNGTSIKSKSVENATVKIDRVVEKEITLNVEITDYSLSEGYEMGRIICPKTVTVRGPEVDLGLIDHALAAIKPGNITLDTEYISSVTLFDAYGREIKTSSIVLTDDNVKITIPMYKTKKIPVKVYFLGGYFTTDMADIVLSSEYISVKGKSSAVDAVSEFRINLVENLLDSEVTLKKQIQSGLPDGIECVSGENEITVNITFKDLLERFIDVKLKNIEILGLPEGYKAELVTNSLTVKFLGYMQYLTEVNSDNIHTSVDFTDAEFKTGVNSVPLNIILTDENGERIKGITSVGEYLVGIRISYDK